MAVETATLQKENNNSENNHSNRIQDLIYLLICAVNEVVPDKKRIENMDLDSVYDLASYHSVVSIVAFALEKAIELPHKYDQAKKKAIRKLALFDIERSKVFAGFNKDKIWFMPLKGIILKDYYPRFGMREMSDNDILCDPLRMKDIKTIMESLGYTCEVFGKSNHDVYSKSIISFEIHKQLFDNIEMESLNEHYLNIFSKLIKIKENGYEYRFCLEDLYIYLVLHEYQHFALGGTGIRSLLDTYVFLKRENDKLDWKYIESEFTKLNLSEFEKMNRELSNKLFSSLPLTSIEKDSLMFFLSSGTYGTKDNYWTKYIASRLDGQDSAKAKKNYIKSRLFLQNEDLRLKYPFFYKHKILLPCLFVFRVVHGLFTKPKEIWREYKHVKHFKNSSR